MTEPAEEAPDIRGIIEAVLMTADSPVSPGRLADLLSDANGRDIRGAIDELKAQYDEAGHAFTIVELAGGFQLATRRQFAPWIRKFHQTRTSVRLSQAALETLAIVAFKQPLTRIEVDNIRGVGCGGVLHTLMEHNLVRIVGRSAGIGKPMLFGTTREFLSVFGLKSLADLPKPKELEELMAEAGGVRGIGHDPRDSSADGEMGGISAEDGYDAPEKEADVDEPISELADDDVEEDAEGGSEAVGAPDERESVG